MKKITKANLLGFYSKLVRLKVVSCDWVFLAGVTVSIPNWFD